MLYFAKSINFLVLLSLFLNEIYGFTFFKKKDNNLVYGKIEERIKDILNYRNEVWHENRYRIFQGIYDYLYEKDNFLSDSKLISVMKIDKNDSSIINEDMLYTSEDIEEALRDDTEESNAKDDYNVNQFRQSLRVDLCEKFVDIKHPKNFEEKKSTTLDDILKNILKKFTKINEKNEHQIIINKNH